MKKPGENGHIGSVIDQERTDQLVNSTINRTFEQPDAEETIPLIGPYRPETENNDGRLMHFHMGRHGLMAVNTHYEQAAGKTYYGYSRDQKDKTRVDYILIPVVCKSLL